MTQNIHQNKSNTGQTKSSLSKLILIPVFSLFLFQLIYITGIALIFKIKLIRFYQFLLITSLYHCLFFAVVILVKKEFYLETTGKPLKRINFPIFLSFFRLSSVPTVIFLLLSIQEIPLLPVTVPFLCLIFLTDLFDGFLARRMNQTTRIGRLADSSSDYMNIIVISILFFLHRLIPGWFFILISLRMMIQYLGMIVLYSIIGSHTLKTTFLGKVSVFATMTLYGFELLEYLHIPVLGNSIFVAFLEYTTAVFISLSLIEKVIFLNKTFLSLIKKQITRPPE